MKVICISFLYVTKKKINSVTEIEYLKYSVTGPETVEVPWYKTSERDSHTFHWTTLVTNVALCFITVLLTQYNKFSLIF